MTDNCRNYAPKDHADYSDPINSTTPVKRCNLFLGITAVLYGTVLYRTVLYKNTGNLPTLLSCIPPSPPLNELPDVCLLSWLKGIHYAKGHLGLHPVKSGLSIAALLCCLLQDAKV